VCVLGGFIIIISAISEAIFAEGQINFDRFSVMFSAFNFRMGVGDITITKQ